MASIGEDWYLISENGGGGESLVFAAEGEKEVKHRWVDILQHKLASEGRYLVSARGRMVAKPATVPSTSCR